MIARAGPPRQHASTTMEPHVVIDPAAAQLPDALPFRQEVAARFGVLPNFFCSADASPGLIEELWKFAKASYLDSPLPSVFKERLFVQLSRYCRVRYCIVRHAGFLIGQGRPAGDPDAELETVEQVIEMLRRPLPEGTALAQVLDRLARQSVGSRLPGPRSDGESDLFDALTVMFLTPGDSAAARASVHAAVGPATFERLVAFLAFVRTAHYWTEMHPELTHEPDMVAVLRHHRELERLLLDASEADLVHGGVRLRDAVAHLTRVETALRVSESRHAFLLRLGDALRPLADPTAIRAQASRMLGLRLRTGRACYAEVDEARGHVVVEADYVRDSSARLVGRYPLTAFSWLTPSLGTGGPLVVDDTWNAVWMSDRDRGTVAAIGVGAFVAAPLFRQGRLAAALCVCDVVPRVWTTEETELVRDTAERAWDAMERAAAEARLRDADVRKDEFLATLAHELRNPLAPIRTGLELIRRGGDSVAAVGRVREMMERQLVHVVRLIDDLLDVSRISSGKIALQREPTRLATVVHSAVEANRAALAAKDIALSIALPDGECVIDVDPTRFVQILSNLLHNAAKFTDSGGSVSIAAVVSDARGAAPPQVSISVADTGVGIAAELLPRVFDLFTQGDTRSSQPGLGIGLAIAHRLAELHAGRLEARSDGHGRGSTFTLQVPVGATRGVPVAVRAIDAQRLERRVLVVDDNEDAADATAMLVEAMGGQAQVAYGGDVALEMLHEYRPEVVLLDIGMRGLDGYETCQRMRQELGRGVVLVALTGFGQEQDREKAARAGFDGHLTKPTDGAALAGTLAQLVGRT